MSTRGDRRRIWTHERGTSSMRFPHAASRAGDDLHDRRSLRKRGGMCGTGLYRRQQLFIAKKNTKRLLDTIKAAADRMWNDPGLMAVGLLKKAVGTS